MNNSKLLFNNVPGWIWHIPFSEVLLKSSIDSHINALKQIILMTGASFLPIFIAAMVEQLRADSGMSYLDYINKNLQWGELLFIYVMAYCVPIAWTLHKYSKAKKHIKEHFTYLIIPGVIGAVSTAIFVVSRSGVANSQNVFLPPTSVTWVTYIAYILFSMILLLAYIALLYDAELPQSPQQAYNAIEKEQKDNMLAQFQQLESGKNK